MVFPRGSFTSSRQFKNMQAFLSNTTSASRPQGPRDRQQPAESDQDSTQRCDPPTMDNQASHQQEPTTRKRRRHDEDEDTPEQSKKARTSDSPSSRITAKPDGFTKKRPSNSVKAEHRNVSKQLADEISAEALAAAPLSGAIMAKPDAVTSPPSSPIAAESVTLKLSNPTAAEAHTATPPPPSNIVTAEPDTPTSPASSEIVAESVTTVKLSDPPAAETLPAAPLPDAILQKADTFTSLPSNAIIAESVTTVELSNATAADALTTAPLLDAIVAEPDDPTSPPSSEIVAESVTPAKLSNLTAEEASSSLITTPSKANVAEPTIVTPQSNQAGKEAGLCTPPPSDEKVSHNDASATRKRRRPEEETVEPRKKARTTSSTSSPVEAELKSVHTQGLVKEEDVQRAAQENASTSAPVGDAKEDTSSDKVEAEQPSKSSAELKTTKNESTAAPKSTPPPVQDDLPKGIEARSPKDLHFFEYDDECVPILCSEFTYHSDKHELPNKPDVTLRINALKKMGVRLSSTDLGRKDIPRSGATRNIDDCDLYLREDEKIYVATEQGLLLAAEYLEYIGVPETQRIGFRGRKPAWIKAVEAGASKMVAYEPFDPDEAAVKQHGFMPLKMWQGVTCLVAVRFLNQNLGFGVRDDGKKGWFSYDAVAVPLNRRIEWDEKNMATLMERHGWSLNTALLRMRPKVMAKEALAPRKKEAEKEEEVKEKKEEPEVKAEEPIAPVQKITAAPKQLGRVIEEEVDYSDSEL